MIPERERAESILALWTERIELVKRKIWTVEMDNPSRQVAEKQRLEANIEQVDQALSRLGVSR